MYPHVFTDLNMEKKQFSLSGVKAQDAEAIYLSSWIDCGGESRERSCDILMSSESLEACFLVNALP